MHTEQYIRCCAKKFQTTLFFGFLYLTQNGTNYNEIFTCDRAKRYLQPVILKKWILQTGSSDTTGGLVNYIFRRFIYNHV